MMGKSQLATPAADKIQWARGVENHNTPSRAMGEDALQFLDLLHAVKVEVDYSIHDVYCTWVVES